MEARVEALDRPGDRLPPRRRSHGEEPGGAEEREPERLRDEERFQEEHQPDRDPGAAPRGPARPVRELVNELVEAKQQLQLRRVLARWERYDLIAIDEVGYVPLADTGAEFLFQVISERAERAALIVTTNLPFSEWTQVLPNARLCKALLDRVTDRAHIIETGTDSYRFRRMVEKGGPKRRVDRVPSLSPGLPLRSSPGPSAFPAA